MKKILAMLLLFGMVFSLCACPGNGPGEGPGGTDKEGEWLDEIDEYEAKNNTDINFGGQTLSISCRDDYTYELYAEQGDTDGISTEVYNRNDKIEKRFNVKIQPIVTACKGLNDQETHYDEVADALNTGKIAYDMISMWAYLSGKMIMTANYLDWRMKNQNGDYIIPFAGESIVEGKEWWPSKMNDPNSVMGHQYVAVSDLCLTSFEMAYGIVFNYTQVHENMGIAQSLGYESMYDIVDKGEWTLSLLNDIVKDEYTDNPNAGTQKQRDLEDTYGLLVSHATGVDAFIHSLGYTVIKNDGEDVPELWNVNSSMVTTIENLAAMCHSTGSAYTVTKNLQVEDFDQFFTEGHALFVTMKMERLRTQILHDMEDQYGVLPYPKLEKNQANYLTGSEDHYNVLSVPVDKIGSARIVGVVVEALSAETTKSVKDIFYKKLLKSNSTRQQEDENMIDIIMEGRVYDLVTSHHADLWIEKDEGDHHLHAFWRVLVREIPNGYTVRDYWARGEQILLGDEDVEGSLNWLIQQYMSILEQ